MTKEKVQKLYADLNNWVEAGIGDDIVTLKDQRKEYQPYVDKAREQGKQDCDIPQAVLWMLREEYNILSKAETQPVILVEKQRLIKDEKGRILKGSPKVAGRAKGVPNRVNLSMAASLARIDFSIAQEAVMIFRKSSDNELKMRILEFLSQYCYPKLKDIDFEPDPQIEDQKKAVFEDLVNEQD